MEKCSFFTSEKILSIHKAQKRYSLSTYTNSRLSSFLNFTELISFSKQTQKAISLNFPQTIREIIFCRFFFNNLPYKIISFPLQKNKDHSRHCIAITTLHNEYTYSF